MRNQNRSITFRINADLYQKYLNIAILRTVNEKRIVNISEIIREALENNLKDEKINK